MLEDCTNVRSPFLLFILGLAPTIPAANSQPSAGKPARIGYLGVAANKPTDEVFVQELRKLGYREKENVRIDRSLFRAVAAFYPECRALRNVMRLNSPLIVFAAGKDDWTPGHTCTDAKNIDRMPGEEFELIVYPNAAHAFNVPRSTTKYKGHVMAYDQQAALDSQKKMNEFFMRHLQRK